MVQSSRLNAHGSMLRASSPSALGIGAASFFCEGGDEAKKDIAESPTACRNAQNRNSEFQNFRISEKCRFKVTISASREPFVAGLGRAFAWAGAQSLRLTP